MRTRLLALCLGLFLLSTLRSLCTDATYVRFHTNLGNIDVQLLTDEAPSTVTNFLTYVNSGAYANSIIHRSSTANLAIDGVAVIQGGGYSILNSTLTTITANAPVASEYGVPNTRGTLAMALTSAGPDSGTNQWFFNTIDNSSALDGNPDFGGPFTVFGVIINTSGLSVMDQISNVPIFAFNSPFNEIPLLDYTQAEFNAGTQPTASDFVMVNSITPLTVQPLSTWQSTNFPGQPASVSGPTATPSNDGVPNLLKYLCDINPTAPISAADRAKLPTVGTTTIGTTRYMTLTYHQSNALVGVTVNVQTSPDLQIWTIPTNPSPTFVQTGTDSSNDPIMQVQVPMNGTKQFIRLNVTQP